jgi:serine/threonine protein phosphatase 1
MVTLRLATSPLPPDIRIYAIGDVHGRADLLDAIHRAIAADLAARPVARAQVVHLGDYIDRGPDSAGVLARLAGGAGPLPDSVQRVNLMGNHEAMLLGALRGGDPASTSLWLRNGGIATLESWGVRNLTDPAVWRASIPPDQMHLLEGLALTHAEGGYLFVHAGVRPGVPLPHQVAEDLLWIREPFLSWPHPHGAIIVHGHTPVAEPVIRTNRIGIDTAAAMGGVLTCAVLEGDGVALIQR